MIDDQGAGVGDQPEMLARVAAAQATLDEFKDKPFRFGERDCVRLVAAHLRRLGYRVRLPAKGSYRSARSALKALRARGHDTLADAIDALGLEQIAPAAALVGDLVQGESGDVFGALGVMLGNGRLVGYHEHAPGAAVLQAASLCRAWRVAAR